MKLLKKLPLLLKFSASQLQGTPEFSLPLLRRRHGQFCVLASLV